MEYLDSDSEKILKIIIKYEKLGFKVYITNIFAITNGKYKDKEIVRILQFLCEKGYVFTNTDSNNNLPYYYISQVGNSYFKSKNRDRRYKLGDWIKMLISALIGVAGTLLVSYLSNAQ